MSEDDTVTNGITEEEGVEDAEEDGTLKRRSKKGRGNNSLPSHVDESGSLIKRRRKKELKVLVGSNSQMGPPEDTPKRRFKFKVAKPV